MPVFIDESPCKRRRNFYRWFSERRLTAFGQARRRRTQRFRLALVSEHATPPGDLLEVGPGEGSFAEAARSAGWRYRGVEGSEGLARALRARGFDVTLAWVPPIDQPTDGFDVFYADQVLEHMSGIDGAREFVAEAYRCLRPGGVLFVVVPNYLKEGAFFWDVDYTHNFVTTERRMRQLIHDGGFEVERVVRSIGNATGLVREMLTAGAMLVNIPGVDALARYTRTEEQLFRIRKNLFETLTLIARKPVSAT